MPSVDSFSTTRGVARVTDDAIRFEESFAGSLRALYRGYRRPDRIPLERIESVSATRGEKGLTRPRVVITYASDGTSRQRRVNLSSMYTRDGETVYERALDALERRGFEVE